MEELLGLTLVSAAGYFKKDIAGMRAWCTALHAWELRCGAQFEVS